MLLFFNIVNDNKLVKEGAKIILDKIVSNLKIYVPLPTRVLTMQEASTYDGMINERFKELSQQARETIRTDDTRYH